MTEVALKGNLQGWLVAAFTHPSVCKELVKLLDAKGISVRLKVTTTPNLNAEGEDDGTLSLQVIAGHWKALGFSAALWN